MFKQSSMTVNIRELVIFDVHLQNSFRFQVRYFKTHSKSPFKLPNLNMFSIFCLLEIIRHQTADQMKIVRILNKSKETWVFSSSLRLYRGQTDCWKTCSLMCLMYEQGFMLSSLYASPSQAQKKGHLVSMWQLPITVPCSVAAGNIRVLVRSRLLAPCEVKLKTLLASFLSHLFSHLSTSWLRVQLSSSEAGVRNDVSW